MIEKNLLEDIENRLLKILDKVAPSVEQAKLMMDSASQASDAIQSGDFHVWLGEREECDELVCRMNSYMCPLHGTPCKSQKNDLITVKGKNFSASVIVNVDTKDSLDGRLSLPIDSDTNLIAPLKLLGTHNELVEALCLRLSLHNWITKNNARLGGVSIADILFDETRDFLKKMPYKEYLLTDKWKEVRQDMYKRADYRCQLCNTTNQPLHVHHRTYENRGNELASNLIVLCEDCHRIFHEHGKLRN